MRYQCNSPEDAKREKAMAIMFSDSDSCSDNSDIESSSFSDDDEPLVSLESLSPSPLVKSSSILISDSSLDFSQSSQIPFPKHIAVGREITPPKPVLLTPEPKSIVFLDDSDSDDEPISINIPSTSTATNDPLFDSLIATIPVQATPIIPIVNLSSSDSESDDEPISTNPVLFDNLNMMRDEYHPLDLPSTSSPGITMIPRSPAIPEGNRSILTLLGSTKSMKPLEQLSSQLEREANELSRIARQQTVKIGSVTSQMIQDTQQLLRLFGIPYVVSPSEAESQCAKLLELGLVDAIATEDSDVFLFGGDNVYRNLFNQRKDIERYSIEYMTNELGLSRDMLIEFALLVGSDYTPGIKGIGVVLALEILAEFSTVTNFATWFRETLETSKSDSSLKKKLFKMKNTNKLVLSQHFPERRVIDAYMNPHVTHSTEEFTWALPQSEPLKFFMASKVGWSSQKTDQHLIPVVRSMANLLLKDNTAGNVNTIPFGEIKLPPKLTSLRVTNAFERLTNSPLTPKQTRKRRSFPSKKTPPKKKSAN